jgi:hypothetical protein
MFEYNLLDIKSILTWRPTITDLNISYQFMGRHYLNTFCTCRFGVLFARNYNHETLKLDLLATLLIYLDAIKN